MSTRQRNLSKDLWTPDQHALLLETATEILPTTGPTPPCNTTEGAAFWKRIEAKAGGGRGVKACYNAFKLKPSYLAPPAEDEVDQLEEEEVIARRSPTPTAEAPVLVQADDAPSLVGSSKGKAKARADTPIKREPSDDDIIFLDTPQLNPFIPKMIKRERSETEVAVFGDVSNAKMRKGTIDSFGTAKNVAGSSSPLSGKPKPSLLESMVKIAELASGSDDATQKAADTFAQALVSKWHTQP
ncbi:hypothetical protein P7C70_g6455, partial [Phenoliferia sp. Uapishka_3]